ncbi:creatininase family protein [Streptomonospora sp. NEAU-YY374]|nr:creatininase family protein [Streptomonospora nanhaiensis]MBV2363417.1 creatininase family protein [Streptomonospora nanhaiensis]MBX9389648.1 creatininase family protein [Streptomonospora nanhaiensis]
MPTETTSDVRARGAGLTLLPIGSHEQHGPHLPLATDTVIAATLAAEIAEAHGLRVLPPVAFSCSQEHAAWPGTVSVSAATLYALVRDIAESVRASGATGLVLVNGHGGNYVLGNLVQEVNRLGHRMALFPAFEDWADARTSAGVLTTNDADMHAGELETSILLHAHPHLVGEDYTSADHLTGDRRHMLTLGLEAYTPSGVVGRPSLATAEKGEAALSALVRAFETYRRALEDS